MHHLISNKKLSLFFKYFLLHFMDTFSANVSAINCYFVINFFIFLFLDALLADLQSTTCFCCLFIYCLLFTDALLAVLQSTTSHISSYQNSTPGGEIAEDSPPPPLPPPPSQDVLDSLQLSNNQVCYHSNANSSPWQPHVNTHPSFSFSCFNARSFIMIIISFKCSN